MSKYNCCTPHTDRYKGIEELSSILGLVGEESRLKILCILLRGEHCVGELVEHVELSQSLTSHHLKDLKDAGIVMDEKRGLQVFYSLTDKGEGITRNLFQITKPGRVKK